METKRKKITKWLLILTGILFLAVFLVLPLVYVLVTALRDGWNTYLKSVLDPDAVKAILLTVEVVLITVVINTIFGIFAAWVITKFTFRGKKVISTLIDLPLTISPVIAAADARPLYSAFAVCSSRSFFFLSRLSCSLSAIHIPSIEIREITLIVVQVMITCEYTILSILFTSILRLSPAAAITTAGFVFSYDRKSSSSSVSKSSSALDLPPRGSPSRIF